MTFGSAEPVNSIVIANLLGNSINVAYATRRKGLWNSHRCRQRRRSH